MKKFLILLLCVYLALPVVTYATESTTIGFDNAELEENTIVLPMYISDIPDGLNDISALTIHFTFDTSVLEFIGLRDGSITNIKGWYNRSEKNPNKVIVSWFDSSSDNSNALTEDNVGKSNPIFYAEFEVVDPSAGISWINIETASAYDYSSNPAENIKTVAGFVSMHSVSAVENAYGLSDKSLLKITNMPEGFVPVVNGTSATYFGKGSFAVVADTQYDIELKKVTAMPEKAMFGKLHAGGVTAWDALVTNDEALERNVKVFDDVQMYVLADIDGNGKIEAVDAMNINKISLYNNLGDVPNWVDKQ